MTTAIEDATTAIRAALVEVCRARPPEWLVSAVCRADMIGFVAQRRRGEEQLKPRAGVCEDLEKVHRAAKLLKAKLGIADITQALDNALPHQLGAVLFSEGALLFNKDHPHLPSADPVLIAFYTALNELEKRARVAQAGLFTVKGRGANKVMRQGKNVTLPSAKLFCALLLCEVWRVMHGELLSSKNDRAEAACAGLWTAAGGGKASASGNGLWWYWLKQALVVTADEVPLITADEAPLVTADEAPLTLLQSWAGAAHAILGTANLKKPPENNAVSLPSAASPAFGMVSETEQETGNE